jgi:hypothetical protein
MVAIVKSAFPGALESLDNILTPEEDTVKKEGANLSNS